MTDTLRLRQICLAAPRLAPVVDDLQTIFGLSVCYRDPKLIAYGLENALLPIGTDFLEVVAPVQPDTAAGRFIHRSQGHGGYMAIFQTDNPKQRQAAALALGVRTAHEIDQPGYLSVQLHPRDCRAAFIELGHSPASADGSGLSSTMPCSRRVSRGCTWFCQCRPAGHQVPMRSSPPRLWPSSMKAARQSRGCSCTLR